VRVYRYAVQGRCASVSIRRAGAMCECIDTPCRGDVRVYRYAVRIERVLTEAVRVCIDAQGVSTVYGIDTRAHRPIASRLRGTARCEVYTMFYVALYIGVDCVYGTMRAAPLRCDAPAVPVVLSLLFSPALSLRPSLPSEAGLITGQKDHWTVPAGRAARQ
jgi:hypothetical protein